MIQSANYNTSTNFQSGRNIRIKPGSGLDIRGMRSEQVQTMLSDFTKDSHLFQPIGKGSVALSDKGIKLHVNQDGDQLILDKQNPYKIFQHPQTKEYLAVNPAKNEIYATPELDSTHATSINDDTKDGPFIEKLVKALGLKK